MGGHSDNIGHIADAVQLRAARYRDQAARFPNMAADEPVAELRHRLVDLAHEYHQLAARLEERYQKRAPDPD